MSKSPWSAYGRLPPKPQGGSKSDKHDPVSGVLDEIMKGREQLQTYLHGVLQEFFEIRSGTTGYRQIISDALAPSNRPETIEERLTRLAREAQTRKDNRWPGPRAR